MSLLPPSQLVQELIEGSKNLATLYKQKKTLLKLDHFSNHLLWFIFHFFPLREAERREKREEIKIKSIFLHGLYQPQEK